MLTATIEDAVLGLPQIERAQLAHKLIESLDAQTEAEIAEDWRNEATRRAADIDSGAAVLVSADAVLAAAQSLLR